MKVYDCFTFYNEFELLELRLRTLWDVVDYFVLVEADRTHNNKPKPFHFWERQDDFKEFFPKIRHLPVEMDVPFNGAGDWSIENAQRDAIIYALEDAAPDDLIFISDVDELWLPNILERIQNRRETLVALYPLPYCQPGGRQYKVHCELKIDAIDLLNICPIALNQIWHYYYFDWATEIQQPTTIIVTRRNLTTPQKIRDLLHELPCITDGGHHFSYMGGVDRVIDKMTSIVEGSKLIERSGGKILDRKHVEASMANGIDVYGRKGLPESKFVPFDARNIALPHVDEFLRKYPHFLREPKKYFND